MDGRRGTRLVGTAVVAVVLLVGCGGDGEPPEALPSTDDTTFATGRFDDLPRYPRSSPLGERHEEGDVVAQSFKADGATPEMVLRWYAERLDGWTVVESPHRIGVGTFRGRWSDGDHVLVVSSTEAPAVTEQPTGAGPTVQYSLSLEPLK